MNQAIKNSENDVKQKKGKVDTRQMALKAQTKLLNNPKKD